MTNTNTITSLKAVLMAFALTAAPFAVSTVQAHTATTLSVDGDATNIKANLKQASYLMSKKGSAKQMMNNYTAAKKLIDEVLAKDPENSEAKELLAKYYAYRAERRYANGKYADAKADAQQSYELNPTEDIMVLRDQIDGALKVEDDAWAAACNEATSTAFDAFKKSHPKSSHVAEIADRKADCAVWRTACADNTQASYQQYLASSKLLFYKDEANARIRRFQMEDDWTAVKDSKEYAQLDAFAKKYPGTDYAAEATNKSTLLQAREKFAAGNHDSAYSLYAKAKVQKSLAGEDLENYNYIVAERENQHILQSDDPEAVHAYLTQMQNSSNFYREFYDNASDHYALLLAKQLSRTSSDAEMNAPATYAKSASVKNTVDSYVSNAKAARRSYNRKQWWKNNLSIGIIGDIEANVSSEYDDDIEAFKLFNWSAGLALRLGCSDCAVDGMLGVKYRGFMLSKDDDDYDSDSKTEDLASAVAIPAELRVKIGGRGKSCRFFVGCGAEYGFVFAKDDYEAVTESSYLSVSPMLGFRTRNIDMSLYYKTYLQSPFAKDFVEYKNMVGVNLYIWF